MITFWYNAKCLLIFRREERDMNQFLNFDKMITPTIIKIVFWIGIGFSVLAGLGMIISGISSYYGGGIQVVMGLLTIVIGPFFVRIYCELLIIFFKMHESLQSIKSTLEKQSETNINPGPRVE